jgi:LPS O-antigen subunit length determinant protein (WzzB/FepE family)
MIDKNSNSSEDEIDILAILKTILQGKKTIFRFVLIFGIIGLFVAIFSENEYTASTTIVTQSSKKGGGSLSGLASLAGINIGGMGQEESILPQLYPQIINSVSFQKELLETLLTIDGQDRKVSYKEYYTDIYTPTLLSSVKKYTIGLPKLIYSGLLGLLKSEKSEPVNQVVGDEKEAVIYISEEEKNLIELLKNQLSITINDKEGYITLSASMPEAKAVADLVKSAQNLLEAYVIDFKVQKSVSQLSFIKTRYLEKEKDFKRVQQYLALYSDRNQGVNTARAKTQLMLLQSEYDLAYSVYSELAKQLETQEIKVKEDTPIFTIIEPVFVPLEKSAPKKSLILVIWIFLGLVISIGCLLVKQPIQSMMNEIQSKKED